MEPGCGGVLAVRALRRRCMFFQKGEASTMHLFCYNYLFDVCVQACGHICATAPLWRSEDDLYELTLYFQYLNPRARTQVFR